MQLDISLASKDQEKCECNLTHSECYVALSQMSTGKSPGVDAFLVEFLSLHLGLLGQDLADLIHAIGELSSYSIRKTTLCNLKTGDQFHF